MFQYLILFLDNPILVGYSTIADLYGFFGLSIVSRNVFNRTILAPRQCIFFLSRYLKHSPTPVSVLKAWIVFCRSPNSAPIMGDFSPFWNTGWCDIRWRFFGGGSTDTSRAISGHHFALFSSCFAPVQASQTQDIEKHPILLTRCADSVGAVGAL